MDYVVKTRSPSGSSRWNWTKSCPSAPPPDGCGRGAINRISPAEARSDGWQPERRKGPSRTPPPIPAEHFSSPGRLFESLMKAVRDAREGASEGDVEGGREPESCPRAGFGEF